MSPKEARKLSENIVRKYRGGVLRRIAGFEKQLDEKYDELVAQIALIIQTEREGRISRAIQDKIRESLQTISPQIEAHIVAAALIGRDAARAQAKAIFKNAFDEAFQSDKKSLRAANQRILGRVYVDNVKLSSRLWKGHKELGRQMATEITQSIRAGKSLADTADNLLRDVGTPQLKTPKYIKEIAEKAKQVPKTGSAPLEKAIASHMRKLKGARDDLTVRVQTEQFLKELKSAQPGQVDAIVERWTKDRMRKHARMIVRHETIEAYKESYRASTQSAGYVKGYQWSLAPNHEPDICDILARQNLYGLGPGGYPVDKVPKTPHLNDRCIQTAIVDVDHFKRIRAQKKGETAPPEPWKEGEHQSGADWLSKQDADTRRKILGPTKKKIFDSEPGRVVTSSGSIRKLRNIEQD